MHGRMLLDDLRKELRTVLAGQNLMDIGHRDDFHHSGRANKCKKAVPNAEKFCILFWNCR